MLTRHSEDGATAVEYAITILVISIALIFGAVQLGPGLGDVMDDVGTAIGGTESNPGGDDDGTPADCSYDALFGKTHDDESQGWPPVKVIDQEGLVHRLEPTLTIESHFFDPADTALPTSMDLQPSDFAITFGSAADVKHFVDCGGTFGNFPGQNPDSKGMMTWDIDVDWSADVACFDAGGNPLPAWDSMGDGAAKNFAKLCQEGVEASMGTRRATTASSFVRDGATLRFQDIYDSTADNITSGYEGWIPDPENSDDWNNGGMLDMYVGMLPGYTYQIGTPKIHYVVARTENRFALIDTFVDDGEGGTREMPEQIMFSFSRSGTRYYNQPEYNYGELWTDRI